jgi:NADH:ubiquinone oxidoreductase subunit C
VSSTTGAVEPARMSPDDLATYLGDRLEQRLLSHVVAHDQLTLTVEPSAVPIAAQLCRDDPRLAFDFFDFLTAVDEREDGFAVIVHLYSTLHRHHIQIRALADGGRDAPTVPTISHIYGGANWHERETYDMFGITFEGHPGLLPRILTVENFEGFPLRKEFLLMTREVKPWPGLKEPKEVEDDEDGDDGAAASRGPSAEEKARMAREKAERAKAKAAEARKRRAREKASASEPVGGDEAAKASASEPVGGDEAAKAGASEPVGGDEAAKAGASEPVGGDEAAKASASEPVGGDEAAVGADATADTPPAATDEVEQPSGDGEVSAEKEAVLAAGAGDDEIASDPQQAAAIADDAVAKDAAAGAVGGDTAAGASGDAPGEDQPVDDAEHEEALASGGAPSASGTPGVEAEGRHTGAEQQAGDVAADETPELVSPTQDAESAPPSDQAPSAEPDETGDEGEVTPTFQDAGGGTGLPPRGPGAEEPRALAGEPVGSTPLAEEVDPLASETAADRPELDRPVGTDADDRIRRLEDERPADASGTSDTTSLRPAVGGQVPPVPGDDEAAAAPDAGDDTDVDPDTDEDEQA